MGCRTVWGLERSVAAACMSMAAHEPCLTCSMTHYRSGFESSSRIDHAVITTLTLYFSLLNHVRLRSRLHSGDQVRLCRSERPDGAAVLKRVVWIYRNSHLRQRTIRRPLSCTGALYVGAALPFAARMSRALAYFFRCLRLLIGRRCYSRAALPPLTKSDRRC